MQRVSAGTDVTEPQRLVHAAVLLHSGICNGGFEHCFRSPTWKLVPTALEAMTTLGLTAPATVVVQARELFQRKYSDGPPPGRGGRDRDFTMLDMDYFRCFPRGEHLFESRVTAHIRAHIEQF